MNNMSGEQTQKPSIYLLLLEWGRGAFWSLSQLMAGEGRAHPTWVKQVLYAERSRHDQ